MAKGHRRISEPMAGLKMLLLKIEIVRTGDGRFFVDVRCNGAREVWSESNHADLDSAKKRVAEIWQSLPERERCLLHFDGELKIPEIGAVPHRKGDVVKWRTAKRQRVGYFQEWDNGTAIIMQLDDTEAAVRGL